MGIAKAEWMEYLERGWAAPEDKFVCADCVEDEFLKGVIASNLAKRKCDYCGKGGRRYIAAPVEAIMAPITSAFFYYFNDPDSSGMPYDGGWVFGVDITTEDALLSISLECHDDLFQDIANAFTNDLWVETAGGHWASSHPSDIMAYAWEGFVREIKHKSRFFFSAISPDPYDPDGYSPLNTLAAIGGAAKDLDLIKKLSAGITFYRVRERSNGSTWQLDADQLGAPPEGSAQAQRMNPPGISYLYLANEKKTALAEVLSKPPISAGIGTFTTQRELRIIDLTQLPSFPSIFDEENHHVWELLQFFHKFVNEISKPVPKDGREHVEYVPSQVVCEYFAKVFRTEEDDSIDGLVYPSAVRPGGTNVVLFPPESGRDGFKELVELTDATEITFDHWPEFSAAIL